MEFRLRDSTGLVNVDFGDWLISRIQLKLVSSIRKYNLLDWDSYLTESTSIKRLYDKEYKAADVIMFAADNLICRGTSGEIAIQFNNMAFVPGFDRLKLDVIVKTINYGTLDTKGCPIFKDAFNYFANDIDTYVGLYYGR